MVSAVTRLLAQTARGFRTMRARSLEMSAVRCRHRLFILYSPIRVVRAAVVWMGNVPEGDARDARSQAAGPPTALAVGKDREVFQGLATQQPEADPYRNVSQTNKRRSKAKAQ